MNLKREQNFVILVVNKGEREFRYAVKRAGGIRSGLLYLEQTDLDWLYRFNFTL